MSKCVLESMGSVNVGIPVTGGGITARFADNFNDIETDKFRLYFFPLQVGDRRAGEVLSLFRIHRGERTTEFLVPARFDLDENERAVVLRNDVDFIVLPHPNAPAKEFVVFGLQQPDRLPLAPSTGF